ncbi:hypothetical protein BD560DRAFT_443409 [Blakeslea trispora]|nr:hypothetical protein BD560DRAFT_443409 [Blakeslea trispora]
MHATRFETVYAIQDFEAENGDEIGFLEGEPILVIQKDDGFDDGWWKGQNMKNEIGLFPKSYIVHNSISSPQPERTKSSAFADDSTLRPSSSSSSTCSNSMLRKSVIRSLFLPKLRFTPPEEWDIEQVQIWLHEMRFTINIVNHFKAQEITGDVLLELTMDSLKELNIPTFGKRFRLYTAINLLKEEYEYQCCNRMSTASSSDGSEEAIESSTTFESIDRFSRHSQISQPSIMSTQNLSRSNHSLPNFTYQKKTLMKASLDMYDPKETGDVGPDTKGWLYKQGCKYKQWNKRWFVLKGINLFYFKSPEDLRMKGIINLRGYRIVPDETIQPGKYSFKAQHFEERTFYFYTDTETSMRQWISPLMKATITRDFSAPVLSSHTIPTVSLGVARRMKPRPHLFCYTVDLIDLSFIFRQGLRMTMSNG